jgi:hypothetical protein
MDLRKIVCGGMDRIHLTQDRSQFEGCCEHGNEPSDSIKCLKTLEQLSDWRLLKKVSTPWR